jgi:polar amino acid transport system substrate-binding protein
MLSLRKVDTFATNKAVLFGMSDELPGSRMLDGRWGLEHLAVAIPKGRELGMAYVRKFAEDAKSEGLVDHAVERAGLRGTVNTQSR